MKKYKNVLIIVCITFMIIAACNSNKHSREVELLKSGIHTVVVQDVIQTSQYTYFRLKEIGNTEIKENDSLWVAVPKTESRTGETLYFKGGYPMKDFQSKELNRTFKEVIFLDSLSKTSDFVKKEMALVPAHQKMSSSDSVMTGKPKIKKIDVKLDPAASGITIAELYVKKASYSGKTLRIKGQVTKFSPEIMGKNWIHIQDGTEASGKYDLTITTDLTAKVGDVITFEGKITLNKDLGYDYFYEVIMEDAKIVK